MNHIKPAPRRLRGLLRHGLISSTCCLQKSVSVPSASPSLLLPKPVTCEVQLHIARSKKYEGRNEL